MPNTLENAPAQNTNLDLKELDSHVTEEEIDQVEGFLNDFEKNSNVVTDEDINEVESSHDDDSDLFYDLGHACRRASVRGRASGARREGPFCLGRRYDRIQGRRPPCEERGRSRRGGFRGHRRGGDRRHRAARRLAAQASRVEPARLDLARP